MNALPWKIKGYLKKINEFETLNGWMSYCLVKELKYLKEEMDWDSECMHVCGQMQLRERERVRYGEKNER